MSFLATNKSILFSHRGFSQQRKSLIQLEILEDRLTPFAIPTNQFSVGAVTGLESAPPDVAIVNSAGDFIAVWESFETDGSGIGVYAQRFAADGTPIETPLLVNDTTYGNQSHPSIATDGNGKVIIAWQGDNGAASGYDIFYKIGDFSTKAENQWLTTPETVVNETLPGNQVMPSASMDSAGNFAIVWQTGSSTDLTGIDIEGQLGTLGSGLIGSNLSVTSMIGDQTTPTSSMSDLGVGNGRLIIAWTGPGGESSEGEAANVVRGQLYSYDTSLLSMSIIKPDYQLTASVQKDQVEPDVAMALDGQFALAWQSEGGEGTGSDIFMRRFDANGDGIESENVPVNITTAQPQRYPQIGIDNSGNTFIVWQSQGQDGKSWGIIGRCFQPDGSESRAEFIVNVTVQGPETNPAVAMNPDGRTLAIWTGPFVPSTGSSGTEGEEGVEGGGGHQPSVFARIFNSSGIVDVTPADTALNVNGTQFQLAAVGAGEDVPSHGAHCTNGNSIVVWQAFEESDDLSGYGIYGQLLTSDGTPVGLKFLINTTVVGYQSHPAVAPLADGGFVVVWQNEVRNTNPNGASDYNITMRMYSIDDNGGLVGSNEILVNSNNTTGNQTHPSIGSDGKGGFVIAWQTDSLESDEYGSEIYARRYPRGFAGNPEISVPTEFRVNTFTVGTITPAITGQDQVSPAVAMNSNGQFSIAWVSDHNIVNDAADTEKSIFVRWFANGSNNTDSSFPEILANTYTKDAQEYPAIGMDGLGNVVLAWQSINQETGGSGVSWGVFARQFVVNPNGSLSPVQPTEFLVNQKVAGPQRFASVGCKANGQFNVAWQSINQDGSSWGVFQREFSSKGIPSIDERLVNVVTSGPQIMPSVSVKQDGDYSIYWEGSIAEHTDGIGGRNYIVNKPPVHSHPRSVSMDEDTSISFSGANRIQVNDSDAGSSILRVNISATSGSISLPSKAGLTFSSGDGSNDQSLVFTGTLLNINNALRGLTYQPNLNFSGNTIVSFTTNDQALNDPLSVSSTMSIKVINLPATNTTYVESLYRLLLNRNPDPSGLLSHVAMLDSNQPRSLVVASIWNSSEHRGIQVDEYYRIYLNRDADPEGKKAWVNALLSGQSEETVQASFLTSQEFLATSGSAADTLGLYYGIILGRSGSNAEIAEWVKNVDLGLTFFDVAKLFLSSSERHSQLVDQAYMDYLYRSPEYVATHSWTEQLDSGSILASEFNHMVLGSDEAFIKS